MAASPIIPSFVANHRVRETLWVQARRCVPGLDLPGDEGRPPEDPDDTGHSDDEPAEQVAQGAVVLEE